MARRGDLLGACVACCGYFRGVDHVSFGMGWIDRLFGTPHDRAAARARFDRKTMLSLGMDPDDLRLVTARKAYGVTKSPPRAS